MDHWAAVIMAAGEGSRMQSNVPKVLHTVCGKEMILYSLDKLSDLGIDRVMVVVSELNYESIKNVVGTSVEYVIQGDPKGTGGAVRAVLSSLEASIEHVLVHGADMPLISDISLRSLILSHTNNDEQITLLTSEIISSVTDDDCKNIELIVFTKSLIQIMISLLDSIPILIASVPMSSSIANICSLMIFTGRFKTFLTSKVF